jgi:myo-inositol-1-phosphate synthase
MTRVGILTVGALGNVATIVAAGLAALRQSGAQRSGMVTELPLFTPLSLCPPEDIVFGGWDIRDGTVLQSVRGFASVNHVLPPGLLAEIEADPERLGTEIFPGVSTNCGAAIDALGTSPSRVRCGSLETLVATLQQDIREWRRRHALRTVVVVNLASTEPPLDPHSLHETAEGMEEIIARNRSDAVRAGTLYAWAAIEEGCPFINFTPSNSPLLPGVLRRAEVRGVPVMGDDGKTGETLVKSVLAPMFGCRNLTVLSWSGYNLLGNMDGEILSHPENRTGKITSKDGVLGGILGYRPHSHVGIDSVPSLDDQKIAWDFIHFQGFLGARMSLQFVWQGFDSLLAAPLVLDLVRLAEFAHRRGDGGLQPQLASFFKNPKGVDEARFNEQFGMLRDYIAGIVAEENPAGRAASGSS